jgi:hypothetical protein
MTTANSLPQLLERGRRQGSISNVQADGHRPLRFLECEDRQDGEQRQRGDQDETTVTPRTPSHCLFELGRCGQYVVSGLC